VFDDTVGLFCIVCFTVNRSNVGEVAAACNVVLQFLLARLRQQHEHCTITKVVQAVKVMTVNYLSKHLHCYVSYVFMCICCYLRLPYFWNVLLGWHHGVAVECRTRDQEVGALRRKNSGQVSHTYVPLSPSSIIWYRRKLGNRQACRAVH